MLFNEGVERQRSARCTLQFFPRNLLKNDSSLRKQLASKNQRRPETTYNAATIPWYTFLVTFSEPKVSAQMSFSTSS
jgi:hypothetical protein